MCIVQSTSVCVANYLALGGDEPREIKTEGSRSVVCTWSGGVTRMDAVQCTHHHLLSEYG